MASRLVQIPGQVVSEASGKVDVSRPPRCSGNQAGENPDKSFEWLFSLHERSKYMKFTVHLSNGKKQGNKLHLSM